ncbi:hypothetical protein B0H17DRAFT_1214856, partial [Mycena rosella]
GSDPGTAQKVARLSRFTVPTPSACLLPSATFLLFYIIRAHPFYFQFKVLILFLSPSPSIPLFDSLSLRLSSPWTSHAHTRPALTPPPTPTPPCFDPPPTPTPTPTPALTRTLALLSPAIAPALL